MRNLMEGFLLAHTIREMAVFIWIFVLVVCGIHLFT
jgi:hypothetical protein